MPLMRMIVILNLVLVIFPVVAWGKASISVSPIRIDLAGNPGQTVSGEIRVINTGDNPFRLNAYAWDWWFTPKKTSVFASPGTYRKYSAAPWFRFNPNKVIVPARSVQVVTVTAAIPADTMGSRAAVLFFEMGAADKAEFSGGAGLELAGRIGVSATVTAKGTEKPGIQIKKFRAIPPSRRQPMTLSYTIKNTGNIILRPRGTVVFLSRAKEVVGQTTIAGKSIFPGQTRDIEAVYTGSLPRGAYTALMNLYYNEALGLPPNKGIFVHENNFSL